MDDTLATLEHETIWLIGVCKRADCILFEVYTEKPGPDEKCVRCGDKPVRYGRKDPNLSDWLREQAGQ